MRSRYDHQGRRASSVRREHPPVRIYRPSLAGGLPVSAFFNGGGWALGNLDTHDRVARDLAASSGAVVVAVDYRLAPEDPFPAAYDGCLGVTRRLLEDGAGLDIDRTRVAVAGDSAGGNLAAVACQQLRAWAAASSTRF
jgi:acetyl esterase